METAIYSDVKKTHHFKAKYQQYTRLLKEKIYIQA